MHGIKCVCLLGSCEMLCVGLPPPVDMPAHAGVAGSVVPQEDVAHPVLPQPHGPPPLNPAHWDTWPYDCASDDEEYGRNVPAWCAHGPPH